MSLYDSLFCPNGTDGRFCRRGTQSGRRRDARRRRTRFAPVGPQHLEEVKAGQRDDPGRAYSVQFTAAAEMLREHDPVQFHLLRRLLKDKQVRLGEFDRLVEQRRRERENIALRAKRRTAAQAARAAALAATHAPRVVGGGVQVGRYLANAQGLFLLKSSGRGAPPITLALAKFTARITAEIRRDDGIDAKREFEIEAAWAARPGDW